MLDLFAQTANYCHRASLSAQVRRKENKQAAGCTLLLLLWIERGLFDVCVWRNNTD